MCRSGIEAMTAVNISTTMILTMIIYREELKEMFKTVKIDFEELWKVQLSVKQKKTALRKFQVGRYYLMSHFFMLTCVLIVYFLRPFTIYGNSELVLPFFYQVGQK